MWDALSGERTGPSFTIAAGPRQCSHSLVRVPWTRGHILLSQIRDFPFRRLLRLAGLRWRYSTPPPHGMRQTLLYNHFARTEYKTPFPNNVPFVVGVFINPLLSNQRLIRLHYSCLQSSCHSMNIVTDLLKPFLGNGLVNTFQRAAMEDVSQWANVIARC
jgi:hypothetical protein